MLLPTNLKHLTNEAIHNALNITVYIVLAMVYKK